MSKYASEKGVEIDEVIKDLHKFPITQSILLLGYTSIGITERIREFAISEVIKLKHEMKEKYGKDMKLYVLDSPTYPTFELLNDDGEPIGTLDREPTDSIIFIDPKRTGVFLKGRVFGDDVKLLNEYVKDLMKNSNLVYVFLELRLSEIEPPDLIGLPSLHEGRRFFTYAPNAIIDTLTIDDSESVDDGFQKEIKKVHGILLLEDFTDIQRADVLSAARGITLDRMIGFKSLSSGVRVIATGNAVETRMASAILSSFSAIIRVAQPSPSSWKNYILKRIKHEDVNKQKILERVVQILVKFFESEGEYFASQNYDAMTLNQFPSPLSWTNAVLSIDPNNCKMEDDALSLECFDLFPTFVGSEAYKHFIDWYNNMEKQ